MQDFGQWLPQSQSSGDFCFSSMMLSQLDSSLEIQTRNSTVALLEKESTHPLGIRTAAGPIEVTRNDAGAIEDVQNGAGPVEVIDLNNTPPPKAKRKKHRPKVFKPPKTPKSATPKPSKVKEEKTSGKRKYVRKNTPAGQPPPEQTGDSHCRSKPKSAKRCLNIDGDVPRESTHPGSQTQLMSADPKDYQQSESSTSQSNVQTQLPCHVGFTTSSMYSSASQMADAQLLPADTTETAIYSSANEMANAQFLPAHYMPKTVLLDLNSSMDQIQNEYTNFVDRPAQFFQSGIKETVQKDPLLELCTGMPGKCLPDLNSSISLMQGMPTNFTEYLLSSPQASVTETQMDKQVLNCRKIPGNSITTGQSSEGVAMRENFNPNPYSSEAWATNQMSHGYRSAQNPISLPKHIEGHSRIENLNEHTAIDNYLKFTTSSYMQTGGALGPHGPHGSSNMHVLDTRGQHNVSNGAYISLGVNFDQQRNGWTSLDACHAATSQGSYFPENYKRMRTDNHSNSLNGAVSNISTPSMYLSNNQNTNVVSAINYNVFTLADAQRLIAREKSRASRGMISFGASGHNIVERSEMIQQHYRHAMHGTACRDSLEAPDEHFRPITAKFTQLPSNTNTLESQNYISRIGSHQLQFLEGNTVKGSDLPAELHKQSTSPQDDTQSSFCIGPSDELDRSINGNFLSSPVVPTTQSKVTDVLRNENYQVEVCGEATAAKVSEKRKVGRPRKEIKPEYDQFPEPCTNKGSMPSEVHNLTSKRQPFHASVSCHQNSQAHLPDITYASYLERSLYTGLNRTDDSNATPADTRFACPLSSPVIDCDKTKMADSLTALLYDIDGSLSQDKIHFPSAMTHGADIISPIMDKYFHPSSSESVSFAKEQSIGNNLSRNDVVAAFVEQHVTPDLQEQCPAKTKQIGGNIGLLKNKDGSHYSSNLYQSEKPNSELLHDVASDPIEKPKDTQKALPEVPADRSKTKKARVGARKKKTYDWDILRKEVLVNRGNEERGQNAKDALDWETIRQIDVKEISDTIRERGMNNMLSERIKAFLNRLVTDHGAIDLEWLRYVDPDKANARLALPGPEVKSLVTSGNPIAAESCHQPYISSRPVNQLDWIGHAHDHVLDNRQPIIEEPASPEPEPETADIKENAIEDIFFDDPEEIPTIKLNFEEFAQNLKNYMQVNNIEIEEADMSSALVAITPEAASIPTPRLKNISRLRTEHQVYELPDSHPLLEGYDQREPDDPCPYLLSIWTPGETAQSTDVPRTSCNSHESGKLCDSSACFSCNSIREAQAQKVRGTILIPCRTAMRGSFPLNGTYFQVNEVFADHDSSRNPVDVPRRWIWDLPKRTVYFGTSTPSIFKGLTTEEIQHCFWKGFVCVRGFDRISRAPRPLYARLHFPASKVTRNKKGAASAATDDT
uniref:Uncharacterized protein n=1 Tax=Avena sativa TaxID=4498 RepID=A0ACD5XQJ7_AVESA